MNAVREFMQNTTEMAEAFPTVDPHYRPFSYYVLAQIRTPKTKSAGGVILVEDTRETEKWNTQVAKIISLGPVAYKSRTDLSPWPEGAWVHPGMYVRAPKYGGDRFEVPIPGREEKALFAVFKDLDLTGEVTGDPLAVLAFI